MLHAMGIVSGEVGPDDKPGNHPGVVRRSSYCLNKTLNGCRQLVNGDSDQLMRLPDEVAGWKALSSLACTSVDCSMLTVNHTRAVNPPLVAGVLPEALIFEPDLEIAAPPGEARLVTQQSTRLINRNQGCKTVQRGSELDTRIVSAHQFESGRH